MLFSFPMHKVCTSLSTVSIRLPTTSVADFYSTFLLFQNIAIG